MVNRREGRDGGDHIHRAFGYLMGLVSGYYGLLVYVKGSFKLEHGKEGGSFLGKFITHI